MPPELIANRYRVERAIGRGGMGTVWLCTDQVLGREVAVKQVGLFFGESATDTARALREARNTAALNHRNVVSVLDVAQDGDDVWLVMEHIPSRTLAEIIQAEGRLEPVRAARIGAQVAAGLAAAHALGTIHRDVKPGNVLVTEGDHAKIGDFGIARGRDDPQLTQTGLLTGTPSYFSPEVARGGDPGPEADVWALGATLYAAVEGRPPYVDRGNALALLQVIAHEPAPRAEHAGVLAEPISRMMDRDPANRWTMADAAQVLRRLTDQPAAWDTGTSALPGPGTERAAEEEPAEEEPAEPTGAAAVAAAAPVTPSGPPPAPREPRRSRLPVVIGLAAALLLIGAAALGVTLLRDDGAPRATGPAASPTSQAPEPSPTEPADTPSPSPSPSPTDDAESPQPSPSPAEASPPAPRPAAVRERFVDDYFDTVPGDLDAAWQLLSPRMQQEVGRDSFESFWGQMAEVDATSVRAGNGGVGATVTYTYDSGRVVRQQNQYALVRAGSGYLIDEETVVSSTTISE